MAKPFNKIAAGRSQAAAKAKRQKGRLKVGPDFIDEEWGGEVKLEELLNEMIDGSIVAMEDTKTEGEAKAPRDTERYAESYSDPELQRYGNTVFVTRITTNVEYAPFVEFGTEKTAPQPAFTKAFRKHKNKFRRELKNKLSSKISDK